MKYIIEIAKEYEEYFKGILICGIAEGKFAVDVIAKEDLEELNSDYINEHFSDLQDDAYNKGYAQCQDDYSDALKHAKDTAYKKGFEDGKGVSDKGCEGCKFEGNGKDHSPCDYCCNGYSNQYQAKQTDEGIKAGDIVERYIDGKLDSTGIYLGENDVYWNCLFWTGATFIVLAYPKEQFKKTGRHFDIASILKEMQS